MDKAAPKHQSMTDQDGEMVALSIVLHYLLVKRIMGHSWVEEISLIANDGSVLDPPAGARSIPYPVDG